MHTIPQITGRKSSILVHNPNRGLRLIQPRGPARNRRVQLLDLAVEVADTKGDDLGNLYPFILLDSLGA